jgi:hypothetical protein
MRVSGCFAIPEPAHYTTHYTHRRLGSAGVVVLRHGPLTHSRYQLR